MLGVTLYSLRKPKQKDIGMIKRILTICLTLAALSIGFFATNAEASQCIYNNSGTSLNITWYNSQGKIDNNSSNANLLFGQKACQNNSNQGWATVQCNGCAFAEAAAKGSIIAASAGAFGVCVFTTGGVCAASLPGMAYATYQLVETIPPAFKGKLVLVPNLGNTIKVSGNAFGLKIEN